MVVVRGFLLAQINVYKVKEWFAFMLVGMLPTVVFAALMLFSSIVWAVFGWIAMLVLMSVIAKAILRNPFTDMLKGNGLLTLNIDSTGKIGIFISRLSQGVLSGFFDGEEVSDSFDRDGVPSIGAPVKTAGSFVRDKEEKNYTLKITDKELYDSRFAFNQYPCLIYNNLASTFVTKTQISNLEKNLVAHNKLIFLAKKVESLNRNTLHFARHVIDQLKPKSSFMGNMPNWVSIMIIVVVLVFVGLLIWKGVQGAGVGGAFDAAKSAVTGLDAPITPKG